MARKFRYKSLVKKAKTKKHRPGGLPRTYSNYSSNLQVQLFDIVSFFQPKGEGETVSNARITMKLHVKSEGRNNTTDPKLVGKSAMDKKDQKPGWYTCTLQLENQQVRKDPPRDELQPDAPNLSPTNRRMRRAKQADVRKFLKDNELGGKWQAIPRGDEIWHMKVPRLQDAAIMMRCTCPDFRHVGEHGFAKLGLLVGDKRKYRRKTLPPEHPEVKKNLQPDYQSVHKGKFTQETVRYKGKKVLKPVDYDGKGGKLSKGDHIASSRPHKNPAEAAIMCKHLYNCIIQLQREGFLTGAIDV